MHKSQNDEDNDTCFKPRAKLDPENKPLLPKRVRLVFDGVHVPTLAEVRRRQADEEKRDFEKLALLKNVRRFLITSICSIAGQFGVTALTL